MKKITIKYIVDKYLASKGMKRIDGNDGSLSPILPFMMMDMARQLYHEHIHPIDCKFAMAKAKNGWIETYNSFNHEFFRIYNEDEANFITDLMDAFENYIKNDMVVAYWQVTNVLTHLSFEKQKVIAACIMINVFCQSAGIMWSEVYKTHKGYDQVNMNIKNCERLISVWRDLYYGKGMPYVDLNKYDIITDAVSILCKKQINFLQRYSV